MLNKKTQLTRSARTVLSFYPRTLLAYSLYFQTLLLSYALLLSYSSIFILSVFTHSLPPPLLQPLYTSSTYKHYISPSSASQHRVYPHLPALCRTNHAGTGSRSTGASSSPASQMMRTRKQDRQPSAEPANTTKRVSRKRRASSASVDAAPAATPASSSTSLPPSAQSTNKRRKRHEASADITDIVEESTTQTTVVEHENDDVHNHPAALSVDDVEADDDYNDNRDNDNTDNANGSASRHVRFSQTAESTGNGSTSTHLTPHVNKHKKVVHRRITLSPATLASALPSTPAATQKKPKSRASLPADFSLSQASPSSSYQELQFAPLSQILQERVKRRLRRSHLSEETNDIHQRTRDEVRARTELRRLREDIEERDDRVRQLMYELEMQRQLGIDVSDETAADRRKIKDMELEVAQLKHEIEEKRQQEASLPQVDGVDDMDIVAEDMMIINSPIVRSQDSDIAYPLLPSSQDAATPLRAARLGSDDKAQLQVALPESNFQAEREAFEEAVKFWTREASDAKAALQILTIELQSLGFGDSTEVVLTSIRDSFALVRERIESALPGQVPSNLSNQEVIELVAEHLESLADRVATQEAALVDADKLHQELAREVNGLVDRLSEAELRKRELERSYSKLDAQAQEDEVFIIELEEKLKTVEKDHAIVQGMLNAKNDELVTLVQTNEELDSSVDKLGQALDGYRTSEEKLQALIERMETEHRHAIADLEQVHRDTVNNLDLQLEAEHARRDVAEQDALTKQTLIAALELRIVEDESSINSLKLQLASVLEDKMAQEEAREAAEGEVNEKTTFIEELETKIERAEKSLEELRGEIERLRDLHEAEKRQREAAEAELDVRESKIDHLNNNLHEQGIQANQLRQKLFEIQMREKEAIQKLEDTLQEREEKFQEDMAGEIERREQADRLVVMRNDTIAELEESLRRTEAAMAEALQERDDKLAELAELTERLQTELERTTRELEDTITELETLQNTSQTRISQLVADIAMLQGQVSEQAATIANLESDAATTADIHATAIIERDEAIANLNHEIFQARTRIEGLESEKTSLERRVEAEAESMLELHSSKDEEIAALKHTILVKQAEVDDLKQKALAVDQTWEELVTRRDEEIEELKSTGEESTKVVIRLTKLNASLKEKLRKFVRDSTATAQAMRDDVEDALRASEQKTVDLHDEGMRVLEEVEAMEEASELFETEATSSQAGPSTNGRAPNKLLQKFKRAGRGRRQFDSGIGVDEGEESMLME